MTVNRSIAEQEIRERLRTQTVADVQEAWARAAEEGR